MAILKMGRLVGIPKRNGGIRPITVSGFFVKLAGALVLGRIGTSRLRWQYAVGTSHGTEKIIHAVRHDMRNGSAVVSLDVTNAFGTVKRAKAFDVLEQADVSLRFGIRQGDATSSYIFCSVMDIAIRSASTELVELGIAANIYAYVDDITIKCAPEHTTAVVDIFSRSLAQMGEALQLAARDLYPT